MNRSGGVGLDLGNQGLEFGPLTLAVAMIASPSLLETIGGGLAVFGAAALLAAIGLLTLRLRGTAAR